eukprot:m.214341 g.214341  ORF g.214341 m.214341 type:complete len:854 (+) comp17193_c0_seq5:98-2659(+)
MTRRILPMVLIYSFLELSKPQPTFHLRKAALFPRNGHIYKSFDVRDDSKPTRFSLQGVLGLEELPIVDQLPGHVVTVTSYEESQFLTSEFNLSSDGFGRDGVHLGALISSNIQPRWVTGPEAGVNISLVRQCRGVQAPISCWLPAPSTLGEVFLEANGNWTAGARSLSRSRFIIEYEGWNVDYNPANTTSPRCLSDFVYSISLGCVNFCNNTAPSCFNNATCSTTNTSFTCDCAQGWTGAQCQDDVNECDLIADLCQNGGTCLNTYGSYECECAPGWTGINCSVDIDECAADNGGPCVNGGNCTNVAGSYLCECPFAWQGINCSQDYDECGDGTEACGSEGRCINTAGSFECDCRNTSTTGPYCQETRYLSCNHPIRDARAIELLGQRGSAGLLNITSLPNNTAVHYYVFDALVSLETAHDGCAGVGARLCTYSDLHDSNMSLGSTSSVWTSTPCQERPADRILVTQDCTFAYKGDGVFEPASTGATNRPACCWDTTTNSLTIPMAECAAPSCHDCGYLNFTTTHQLCQDPDQLATSTNCSEAVTGTLASAQADCLSRGLRLCMSRELRSLTPLCPSTLFWTSATCGASDVLAWNVSSQSIECHAASSTQPSWVCCGDGVSNTTLELRNLFDTAGSCPDFEDCSDEPCGRGQCSGTGVVFECDCDGTGFEGDRCEQDINECSVGVNGFAPCDGNATCFDRLASYECRCNPGYVGNGTRCELAPSTTTLPLAITRSSNLNGSESNGSGSLGNSMVPIAAGAGAGCLLLAVVLVLVVRRRRRRQRVGGLDVGASTSPDSSRRRARVVEQELYDQPVLRLGAPDSPAGRAADNRSLSVADTDGYEHHVMGVYESVS